jgi:uncharacterized Fe-S cluster protein YjdI
MSQKPLADREELAISQTRAYTAPGVRVFYDKGRCLHFAECVRGLPQVFDVGKRPWIQPAQRALLRQRVRPHRLDFGSADPTQLLDNSTR